MLDWTRQESFCAFIRSLSRGGDSWLSRKCGVISPVRDWSFLYPYIGIIQRSFGVEIDGLN